MSERREILEVIENVNRGKRFVAVHTSQELTALCPTTSVPDFYTVKIVYEPDEYLVELKSLKFYLTSFRNVGIYHEELLNEILEDLKEVVRPHWIYVELKVNVRGGIYTTVSRFWSREKGDDIKAALEGPSLYLSEDRL
ncbi:MAG: NADPH-dependent 7-cyano-7-deazaguanine reductase QueF [Thermoplasmata archaeon]|nr:NADPH-dependent 7-cyano-7-deazaguanine reductase QueF [Thermoplasmata archaeon]